MKSALSKPLPYGGEKTPLSTPCLLSAPYIQILATLLSALMTNIEFNYRHLKYRGILHSVFAAASLYLSV